MAAASCSATRNDTGACQENGYNIDTACSADVHAKKENPGALAGAIGTDLGNFWEWFDRLKACRAASAFAWALAYCPPDFRGMLLEAALKFIRPDLMRVLLVDVMRECREHAADLLPSDRKAMCLACYEAMTEAEQQSFAAHITGARHG